MKEKDFQRKIEKLRLLLGTKKIDAILLDSQTNFKWLTGGGNNFVLKTMDNALNTLVVTEGEVYLLATASDLNRLMDEELGEFNIKPCKYDWYNESVTVGLQRIGIDIKNTGSDIGLPEAVSVEDDIKRIRSILTDLEVENLKSYSLAFSKVLTGFCNKIKPGVSELEIEAELTKQLRLKGYVPAVLLVGSDERVYRYRHPVATEKKVATYVLIGSCVEREGLQISLSRAVSFGTTTPELVKRQHSVNLIEANCYHRCKPGVSLGELFNVVKDAYEKAGFPEEWKNHTQGGVIAYSPREFMVTEGEKYILSNNTAVSFNPTIAGVKSEDVAVIEGNIIHQISIDPDWPCEEITVEDMTFKKPLIMQL